LINYDDDIHTSFRLVLGQARLALGHGQGDGLGGSPESREKEEPRSPSPSPSGDPGRFMMPRLTKATATG
jgi:hypothetical protein